MIDKQDILEIVCKYYDLDYNLLSGKSRKSNIVKARQIYCYFCRVLTNSTLYSISAKIDKDHATVIHSVNKIKNEMELYVNLNIEIRLIHNIIITKTHNKNHLIPKHIDLLAISENYTKSFIQTI